MKRVQKIFGKYQPELPVVPIVTAAAVLVFFMSSYQSVPLREVSILEQDDSLAAYLAELPKLPAPPNDLPAINQPQLSTVELPKKPELMQIAPQLDETVSKPAVPAILDDTISIRIKQDEEVKIKSKTGDKTIFLNNKKVKKPVIENLAPESIKSITVAGDEIFVQTKDYEPKSEISISDDLKGIIEIRSKETNKKPLFILDGEIVAENQIQELKPDDIQSINVLKNESAQALYGEKAKNGVIIIKLKK
ncbi:MAG: hypothetical protein ACOCXH_01185 [Cyclobacteriaceae bacterium]